jgi:hypothetical protein
VIEKKPATEMRIQQTPALGDIEINVAERDNIQLWQKQGDESNVVFIERAKLKEVIELLIQQINK